MWKQKCSYFYFKKKVITDNLISDISSEKTFNHFPNPCNKILTVVFPDFNTAESLLAIVCALDGTELSSTKVCNNVSIDVNTSNLPDGTYILNIIGDNFQTRKIFTKLQ